MTPPSSSIERALHYAVLDAHSIESSSQLDDDLKKEQYGKILDQVDSPQKVVELQLRLEEDKPYFQLCNDESIASYFSRWNVPITTRKDLDLFSDALAEKVIALAPNHETVRTQLEQQQYIKQLKGLPAALASLEQAVSQYDTLKPSCKAVVRYVWEAVILNGFKMKEEGSKALEQYEGELFIQPLDKKAVRVTIALSNNDIFKFLINPQYKERILIPAKKRKLWFDRKEKSEETEELKHLEVLPLKLFNFPNHNNSLFYNDWYNFNGLAADYCQVEKKIRKKLDSRVYKISPEKIIDELTETCMKDLDKYGKSFQTYLEILLGLPKLMNNYTQRRTKSMEEILQKVKAK